MNGIAIFFIGLLTTIILLNSIVSYRVLKSEFSEPRQQYLQCALIWLVPLAGAALTYSVMREPQGQRSDTYPVSTHNSAGGIDSTNGYGDYFDGGHDHD
jgi:hypothetical protein